MQAVIYSNGSQECERLQMLLKSISTEYLQYNIGEDFTQTQFQQEFGADAEYPQCALDNKHIGGLKDTLHFLDKLGAINNLRPTAVQ
jgi:hypothetical protein